MHLKTILLMLFMCLPIIAAEKTALKIPTSPKKTTPLDSKSAGTNKMGIPENLVFKILGTSKEELDKQSPTEKDLSLSVAAAMFWRYS